MKIHCFLICMIIVSIFPTISVTGAEAITFTESSTHHKPIIWWYLSTTSQYYYAGAYHSTTPLEEALHYDPGNPPSQGPTCYWTAEATRVTVSFPNTPDPSVLRHPILGDNWLAAGMFVHGCENGSVPGSNGHADWAYYTSIVLDSGSNLWLDVGIYFADESNGLCLDKFIKTWLIGGVDRSTPITLTAAWNASGFIYWTAMINGVIYQPTGAEFNMRVEEPTAMKTFYVGWQNISYKNPSADCCYYFQFGIMSLLPLIQGGWNVLLEDPWWYQDGQWHIVQQAQTTDGSHAYLDVMWRWGGTFGAVEVRCHNNEASMGRYRITFYYSSTPMVRNYCLWSHEPTTPPTPSGYQGGYTGVSYSYIVYSTDPEGTQIKFWVDWDDGTYEWTDYHESGMAVGISHTWSSPGTYNLIVCAFDSNPSNLNNDWSPNLAVGIISSDDGGGHGGSWGCPFVSVWKGSQYVLDNNLLPLSLLGNGSDVEDYYRLEQSLVPKNGKYSLLLSEFQQEHSYIDQVKLMRVDHKSDVKIAVTPDGEILTYKNPTPPISAVDTNGTDRLDEIRYMDASLSDPATFFQGNRGDYLVLNFGQVSSDNAKLIVRNDQLCMVKCINVEVMDGNGEWQTAAVIASRAY